MMPGEKKLAVLRLLGQENDPINLPELLAKLPHDYAERSTRRWLDELIVEGFVQKSGQKRSTKYQVVKRKDNRYFSLESVQILAQVRQPIYQRLPVSYQEQWFNSYEPNISFYLSPAFRDQLRQAGTRLKINDAAGTYAHQIFNRLLIDLSYNSSRLEGNTYSRLDTERLLLSGTSAEGKLDEEKVMILNHKEAIRYLVDNASKLSVNLQTICTLHYLLAEGLVESKYAGKVRDHGVRIGGSTYMPFEDPKQLQEQLLKISEKAGLIKDPFEQSFFLLVHVSYLQAFADVNKRTARLCSNIPLIPKNLVPLSFNDIEREDYTSAMIAVYELQEVQPMIDLYVFSYLRTCVAYDSTVKAIGFDEERVRYRQQRRVIISEIVLRLLTGDALWSYAKAEIERQIPADARQAVLADLQEDLEQIDQNRIAGLGISAEQLQAWHQK
ncbi:MAG: Fic family protein [Myxococcaceae bacterium]